MRAVSIVVAATSRGGIGRDGKLPWDLPADMQRFREITTATLDPRKTNAVIMGRKTWASIPPKFRPLKGRLNVVLSGSADVREKESLPEEVLTATSLREAVLLLSAPPYADTVERIFVIGGAAAFAEALGSAGGKGGEVDRAAAGAVQCDTVHLTRVYTALEGGECDVHIPDISDEQYALVDLKPRQTQNGVEFQFLTYRSRAMGPGLVRSPRPNADLSGSAGGGGSGSGAPSAAAARHEEMQYLDAIRDILATGVTRSDRTGTGTLSKFGVTSRWSLRGGVFPLLTTKRVFWRAVAEELLWFVAGNTSGKDLSDKGVHIWDGNGSREFLDKSGLGHREEGDLGPVYGFQWRHFGAAYGTMRDDYAGKGVDQLADVVHRIRTNPTDRRIILSAWNPAALREMALPPCHMFAQFYVDTDRGELSCCMYQRSGDMGLGVPFNIASYSLLTRMLAQVCGLQAGELVHVIGDAHVYSNHVAPLLTQLERSPRAFPTLAIDPSVTSIDGFRFEHFTIEGYDPWPTIKMEMAV